MSDQDLEKPKPVYIQYTALLRLASLSGLAVETTHTTQ